MGNKDWKDQLNSLLPEGHVSPDSISPISNMSLSARQQFILRFEKRNGKPTTIISNFQGTTKELEELASALKKYCSAGGSAKDDEILIQGDVRQKVVTYLKKKGHLIKGDFQR